VVLVAATNDAERLSAVVLSDGRVGSTVGLETSRRGAEVGRDSSDDIASSVSG